MRVRSILGIALLSTAATLLAVPSTALATLPGAPAPPADPQRTSLLPEAMKGPFASLAAACRDCRDSRAVQRPAAPFLEVRIVVSGDFTRPPSQANPNTHVLAARLASGWWLREIGIARSMHGRESEIHKSLYEHRFETADVLPGGGAEVLIETRETIHGEEAAQVDNHRLHVCGVGASGRPSCTVLHTYHFTGSSAGLWDTPAVFRKDGTIVLADRRHVIAFP
jgi:hypothetical protein